MILNVQIVTFLRTRNKIFFPEEKSPPKTNFVDRLIDSSTKRFSPEVFIIRILMTFMLNPKSRYFEWKNYAHMLLYNNFGICIDLQGIEMLNYL